MRVMAVCVCVCEHEDRYCDDLPCTIKRQQLSNIQLFYVLCG